MLWVIQLEQGLNMVAVQVLEEIQVVDKLKVTGQFLGLEVEVLEDV
jgi:hypothetical protein